MTDLHQELETGTWETMCQALTDVNVATCLEHLRQEQAAYDPEAEAARLRAQGWDIEWVRDPSACATCGDVFILSAHAAKHFGSTGHHAQRRPLGVRRQ